MEFQIMYFTVEKIDGDYAYLRKDGDSTAEPTLVARALLPDRIKEGMRLKYELLQYQIVE